MTKGRIKQSIVFWCFNTPGEEWDLEQTCQVASQLGCASVEVVEPMDWPTLKKHNLVCALAPNGMPGAPFVKGYNNPRYHDEVITRAKESIDACAKAGFPNVIAFTGYKWRDADGPDSGEISPEEGANNCVAGLTKIAGYAEKQGVTICLEHLNTRDDTHPMKGHPGYQGDDIDYVASILRRVGSPRVKLLFDIYHVQVMHGDVIRRIEQNKDIIGHVHTAGCPGRGEMDDAQEIYYPAIMIPSVWYGLIVIRQPFPKSDVAKAGIRYGQMLKEFASPVLLLLLLLQVCVGYVELGTDSWIANITNSVLSGQGLLLFVYAAAIMFILRFFAGPIVERINPLGLLCASTVLGTSGLLLLGSTSSAALMWIAVTIYGFGKTFLWPTMLGVVGERFPRGGAITMGAIGAAGALSGGLLGGPGIGYKQDVNATAQLKQGSAATYERYMAPNENGFLFFPKVRGLDGQKVGVLLESNDDGWAPATTLDTDYRIAADRGDIPDDLQILKTWWDDIGQPNSSADKDLVAEARMFGGQMALKLTAAVPALMFVGYLLLVLHFRAQGGYRTVELAGESTQEPGD